MFFGACLYGLNDISFDWFGYLYLLMNCLATTAYQIRVKVLVAELKMSPLTMSYYNNLLSIPVLLILSALQGQVVLMLQTWNLIENILTSKYGYGFWVTMAHCDEFYYHDPNKIVQLAEEEGVDGIFWFALHVLPHPSEFENYKANPMLSATTLFHHYHYYGEKGGFADFRSFKHSPRVHFRRKWSVMLPEGLRNVWSKHPAYLHYKVKQINPKNYDSSGHNLKNFAQARKHGSKNKNGEMVTTGLSWPINTEKDFFVTSYRGKPKYKKCRRFDGNLPPELNQFPNWTRHDLIIPAED
ncbi:unnamed protein product [Bathycoccus prasinos]